MSERVLRYYSEFGSRGARRSAVYRVELYGPAGAPPKEVSLAWDCPAVIEWGEVSKTEPVQGSSLTLRLISESDREFTHLYTTEVGAWSAKVLRNGELYWQGTLDTELYEEPYSTCDGYEVELPFSDFGAMDRLDFGGSGIRTLRSLIDGALTAAGLPDMALQLSVSTALNAESAPLTLEELRVNTANFYDEDGEPMSQREVVEGVLQPLGLRMVQRGGVAHVFDLNAAALEWHREELYWTGSDSTLGVDKTYNKVNVKLSTYSESGGCDGSAEADDARFIMQEGSQSYDVDPEWRGEKLLGFTVDYGFGDAGALITMGGCRLGVFNAEYSGSDTVAAIWQFVNNNIVKPTAVIPRNDITGHLSWDLINPITGDHGSLVFTPIIKTGGKGMRVAGVPVGIDGRRSSRYKLKVSLELLLDTRYNPFEGNAGAFDGVSSQTCIPARLTLYQVRDGVLVPTHFYSNRATNGWLTYTGKGVWMTVADNADRYQNMEFWLSYYSWTNYNKKSGLGGWICNKKTIYDLARLTKAAERRGDGEFVDLPPASGYLGLEIGRGFAMRGVTQWYSDLSSETEPLRVGYGISASNVDSKILGKMRWLCYRNPKVELVKDNGKEVESQDMVDSAWIVRSAAEELSIDTVTGTPGNWALPTSRALLLDTEGKAVKELYRAGVTDRVERLLIGTVYSQYAIRRATLKGHCELLPKMCVLTDASDAGGTYIMLGETQDLAAEESEIFCAQFGADDYKGIEMTTSKEE